jgi:hypothetical protein
MAIVTRQTELIRMCFLPFDRRIDIEDEEDRAERVGGIATTVGKLRSGHRTTMVSVRN